MPGSETATDLSALPTPHPATGRIEEKITCASDPLTSCSKALKSLVTAPEVLIATSIAAFLKNQLWIIIQGTY